MGNCCYCCLLPTAVENCFYVIFENVVGRCRHLPVVVASELVDVDVGVSDELEHTPHIGIFLITPIELEFTVACDYYVGWGVFADVE